MKRLLLALALAVIPTFALADTLYVTEFVGVPTVSVYYQAVTAPPAVSQIVAIGASTTQSAAFGATTGIVRVHADIACLVQVGGTNPSATATSARMAAGQTEYFVVKPGDKIAVKTP